MTVNEIQKELAQLDGLNEAAFCVIDFSTGKVVKREVDALQKKIIDSNLAANERIHEVDQAGNFQRQAPRFIKHLGSQELPIERNRYRLVLSKSDSFAQQVAIVRNLLDLDDDIEVTYVNPIRTKEGWQFSNDVDGVDPVLNVSYLGELYIANDAEYNGRATVPALIDILSGEIVNNDGRNLPRILETEFLDIATNKVDLYPINLREQIDQLNDEIYDQLGNAVYEAGFARSQVAYETAYNKAFAELAVLDERLATEKFLLGDDITDADVRLFTTLVRFDTGYYQAFHVNKYLLTDFKNFWRYARDLYKIPAFRETTDFDDIKKGLQLGDFNDAENPYKLVAKGPSVVAWRE
ncbi:glutathione S-transferase family protein [Periweissella cryptocerci]|uniref:Glutathione S-transferase family protein n=1 Tax=Periweissella cryptocerci TaxID=2506420 RepID=A0A4P6YT29_9LACO|nr:glutathione S-transferase C-terminal domain-containing protein [Periweissella cryptocerci]QBO35797.1 glutathione S-transferase family protein [Periweissella cryptocerci]